MTRVLSTATPLMMKRFLRPALATLLIPFMSLPAANAESAKAPAANPNAKKFEFSVRSAPAYEEAASALSALEVRLGRDAPQVAEQRERLRQLHGNTLLLINVRSAGGPLSAFLAESDLSRFGMGALTVINAGDPADLETELPPFNLRNSNWGTIVGVLSAFLNTRGLELKVAGSDNPNVAESKSVVCVLRRIGPSREFKSAQAPVFDSFQLAPSLEFQSIDDIVAAIRLAWELDPSRKAADLQLKFHAPTAMLLVSGPPEAVQIAQKVVVNLKRDPLAPPPPVVVQPSPAQEQARLDAVAREVARRRDLRDQATTKLAPNPPPPKAAPQR
jgi:hypothetical protein